jgi:hypothetical protein
MTSESMRIVMSSKHRSSCSKSTQERSMCITRNIGLDHDDGTLMVDLFKKSEHRSHNAVLDDHRVQDPRHLTLKYSGAQRERQ